MKRVKKNPRVLKTKRVNDEIFSVIAACAYVLTDCQHYNNEAVILANNLWKIYHQFGGHSRFPSTKEFWVKLRKEFILYF